MTFTPEFVKKTVRSENERSVSTLLEEAQIVLGEAERDEERNGSLADLLRSALPPTYQVSVRPRGRFTSVEIRIGDLTAEEHMLVEAEHKMSLKPPTEG